jgi:hypothetical protein
MTDMNGRERMKKLLICGAVLAAATLSTSAFALDRANTAQKGSLLIFPKIDVSEGSETIVRIENTYWRHVNVQCYWQNGTKAYRSQEFHLTPFQPLTLKASQFLPSSTGPFRQADNSSSIYYVENATDVGELKCWAVSKDGLSEMSWNHLAGSATILEYDDATAWSYTAWAFRCLTPTTPGALCGTTPGNLELGSEYDACPKKLTIGFAPYKDDERNRRGSRLVYDDTDLTIATCNQDFRQRRELTYTKLKFDVWNEEETRFNGAHQCIDSWVEKQLRNVQTDYDNFSYDVLGTKAARLVVRGVGSNEDDNLCEDDEGYATGDVNPFRPSTQPAGLVGVISTEIQFPSDNGEREAVAGTNLVGFGEMAGNIQYDPRSTADDVEDQRPN